MSTTTGATIALVSIASPIQIPAADARTIVVAVTIEYANAISSMDCRENSSPTTECRMSSG